MVRRQNHVAITDDASFNGLWKRDVYVSEDGVSDDDDDDDEDLFNNSHLTFMRSFILISNYI